MARCFSTPRVRFARCFALNVEHFSAISFASAMRSMTGYWRGEVTHAGRKFSVELNSVNRKQSDIVINLPRDIALLSVHRIELNAKFGEPKEKRYRDQFAARSRRAGAAHSPDDQ